MRSDRACTWTSHLLEQEQKKAVLCKPPEPISSSVSAWLHIKMLLQCCPKESDLVCLNVLCFKCSSICPFLLQGVKGMGHQDASTTNLAYLE